MSYRTYEDSVEDGKPIELYLMWTEFGDVWRYCSGGADVTFGGWLYESKPISHDKISLCETGTDATVLNVSLWAGAEIATQFLPYPIDCILYLRIYRMHNDASWVQYWGDGELFSASFDEDGIPQMRFDLDPCNTGRRGHRRWNQRACPLALYGIGYGKCNLVEADWKVSGVIASVSQTTIIASVFGDQADGYYRGGKLIIEDSRRLILQHTGTSVVLNRTMPSALAGVSFEAVPGCDHLPDTCLLKFNNKVNYGGNEFLPTDNAFAGHNIMY